MRIRRIASVGKFVWVGALSTFVACVTAHPAVPADPAAEVKGLLASATKSAPVDLSGRDLAGLDLAGVDFKSANLRGAVLKGANLEGANLSNTILDLAVLRRRSEERR